MKVGEWDACWGIEDKSEGIVESEGCLIIRATIRWWVKIISPEEGSSLIYNIIKMCKWSLIHLIEVETKLGNEKMINLKNHVRGLSFDEFCIKY